jgi:ATP-dependent DNA ligase
MKWRAVSNSITLPAPGFIEPCIPTAAKRIPSGPDWVFELKLDGYRLHVRKAGSDVRVYSRRGADFTKRFPRLVKAASGCVQPLPRSTAKASSTISTACRTST